MKVSTFRPEQFIYRTAVAGAMLRVALSGRGENFYLYFNRWVKNKLSIGEKYLGLLRRLLPKVSIADGVMIKESKILPEHYNVILDGTATALGSLKGTGRKGEMGPLKAYKYQIFGMDSDLTRRVINYLIHYFWAPGAIWRFTLISDDKKELERSVSMFRIAMSEFGFGAKHAFRGKMMELDSQMIELHEIEDRIRGELLQPILCEEGVRDCMQRNNITPVGTFRVVQRMKSYPPKAKVVPAIWGRFEASSGYYINFGGKNLIIIEDDLSWPSLN